MSAAPEAPAGGDVAPVPKPGHQLNSCLSCRLTSGGGLILAGAYVFHAAQKVMRHGRPVSVGAAAQIAFAAGLTAWGVFVIADPMAKVERKT